MILYLSTIGISMLIISIINIVCGTASAGFVVLAVVITTAFQFVIDGFFAFVINKLPNKWFDETKKCFHVSAFEQKFYLKLGVRRWKDKVWELGGLASFRKNKLANPNDVNYIKRFIIETNKGVITHRIGYFVGFLGIFLLPLKYALVIGVPVAFVNLVLNIMPTIILRYNLPKLMALHTRLLRKQTSIESSAKVHEFHEETKNEMDKSVEENKE